MIDGVRIIEKNTTYSNDVVRRKYSNEANLKGKPSFSKMSEYCFGSGHSISTCYVC